MELINTSKERNDKEEQVSSFNLSFGLILNRIFWEAEPHLLIKHWNGTVCGLVLASCSATNSGVNWAKHAGLWMWAPVFVRIGVDHIIRHHSRPDLILYIFVIGWGMHISPVFYKLVSKNQQVQNQNYNHPKAPEFFLIKISMGWWCCILVEFEQVEY